MKVVNLMEIEEVIAYRQKKLKTDGNREFSPLAAQVADWGIELLASIRNDISSKAFEATVNQYKSDRRGGDI